jgi:hypothetical protein
LILIIEELIRENQTGLIFGLLTHLSNSKLNSDDFNSPENMKNFDDFNLQKVENVILAHVFQRIIDPPAREPSEAKETDQDEPPSPTKFGLKPDSKRLKAYNFLMNAGKKATSAVLSTTAQEPRS